MWYVLVVFGGVYTKHDLITQVLGPRTWVWASCGDFLVFWEGTQENRFSAESLTAERLPLHAACVARPWAQPLKYGIP